MLTSQTVREYAARLAAGEPTPGGGSAAALVGALAVALGEMAANFTRGKDTWERVEAPLARLEQLRETLLDLTDADPEAYAPVAAAYAMPRATEEEKAARREAIQAALKQAAHVPLQVVGRVADAIAELPALAEHANRNLLSDVGVAAAFALAALKTGWLNVEVNLASIKDEEYVEDIRGAWQERLCEAEKTAAVVWEQVSEAISG
ncbi:cyclodeaminase/cyclohydrolase family protein [bacterium]|nr:cyclodeaminase/cyclohydrolase family protein [bacterium]